ncbi:MAG: hypothetical protein JOY51_00920 [Nevskia sp.]|nr:hypothetical protein [Nevskia sp.]
MTDETKPSGTPGPEDKPPEDKPAFDAKPAAESATPPGPLPDVKSSADVAAAGGDPAKAEPPAPAKPAPAKPAVPPPAKPAVAAAKPVAPKAPPKPKKLKVFCWPHMMFVETVCALVTVLFFTIWAMYVNAPLEEIANPNMSSNPAKAPWYFLGLQELLVYFDPWIAGVGLPMIMIIGLMMIPYIDPNPRGLGYYTRRERPFAWGYFTFGLIFWYVLIVIGYWFRGPAWAWYWPWESWTYHKLTVAHNHNLYELAGTVIWAMTHGHWPHYLPAGANTTAHMAEISAANNLLLIHGFDFLGLIIIVIFYYVGYTWPARTFWKARYERWGKERWGIVMFFVITTAAIFLKMFLRLTFSVKYAWVTPWFNI